MRRHSVMLLYLAVFHRTVYLSRNLVVTPVAAYVETRDTRSRKRGRWTVGEDWRRSGESLPGSPGVYYHVFRNISDNNHNRVSAHRENTDESLLSAAKCVEKRTSVHADHGHDVKLLIYSIHARTRITHKHKAQLLEHTCGGISMNRRSLVVLSSQKGLPAHVKSALLVPVHQRC